MENKNEYFSTKDLHFAAFLKLVGAILNKLERKSGGYDYKSPVYFMFEDKAKCEYLEKVFWNGEGDEIMVNIKDYVDMVRDLRSRTSSVNIPPMRKQEEFYR